MCLLICSISGCQYNDRELYDTEYTALNIWFGTNRDATATATYNFVNHQDMDSMIFYVRLSGVPADHDRTFALEAVEGDINKVTYVLGNYVLPAGAYSGSYPIYFAKPDNYDQFREEDGYIVFKLKEGSAFKEGAENSNSIALNQLYVILQNSVSKPWNWDEDTYPYRSLSFYFGSYSGVKYEFIVSTLGLSDFRILYGTDLSEEADNVVTYLQAAYFVTKCQTALIAFNADAENIALGLAPLTDEYGFTVTF